MSEFEFYGRPKDLLLGSSEVMKTLREQVARAAESDGPVLIIGERGTGKELVARAVHQGGRRAHKRFTAIDLNGTFPDRLKYGELFGGPSCVCGRCTIGKFEETDGGTLFIDEIENMPVLIQDMLLNVFEQRGFLRFYETQWIHVDVRVVCATTRDLEEAVQKGTFRADLYYRINHIEIRVPPLRDRVGDIPELAEHFLVRANRTEQRKVVLSPEAMKILQTYGWPGNMQELRHAIERGMSVCEGETILPKDLPQAIRVQIGSAQGIDSKDRQKRLSEMVEEFEQAMILEALKNRRLPPPDTKGSP